MTSVAAPSTRDKAPAPRVAPALGAAGALPLRLPLAYAGAVGSGLLYWLAFPGVDWWPLALVAWVPLILAMHRQTVRQATLLAWTAGVTMNVAGFSWLEKMLETFSGFRAIVCVFFLLVVCTFQGARIGLLGWVYARATARRWPAPWVFLVAFVASEFAFPVLFPWYFGATVHDVTALTQTAELGGPIAVGVVLSTANVVIAQPALALLERRRIDWKTMAIGAAAVVLAVLYGVLRVRSVDAAVARAPAATVGIAQANMGLLEKRHDFNEGLQRHLQLSRELRAQGADFVVWSETSAMLPVREESYRAELRGVASRVGLPAVFGAVIFKLVPDDREYVFYNSAVTSEADGRIESRYDKEYLLTFGEYLPFGETFPILYKWSPQSGRFSPGTTPDPLLLDVGGRTHRLTALICYEDILPGYTNDAVRRGDPDLLVNLTNDAWFLDTAAPWQHFALTQMRAIEHRRYLVRGTNSGVSGVIDPVGRVVAHSGTFREEGLLATIHWMTSRTPYEIVGNWPWWIVLAGAAAASFVERRRRTPPGPGPGPAMESAAPNQAAQ